MTESAGKYTKSSEIVQKKPKKNTGKSVKKTTFAQYKKAFLAQSVEQLTRNEQVVGSSPMEGSKTKKASSRRCFFEVSSGFEPLYTVLQTAA
jgi:hypothetical protein